MASAKDVPKKSVTFNKSRPVSLSGEFRKLNFANAKIASAFFFFSKTYILAVDSRGLRPSSRGYPPLRFFVILSFAGKKQSARMEQSRSLAYKQRLRKERGKRRESLCFPLAGLALLCRCRCVSGEVAHGSLVTRRLVMDE